MHTKPPFLNFEKILMLASLPDLVKRIKRRIENQGEFFLTSKTAIYCHPTQISDKILRLRKILQDNASSRICDDH